MTLITLIVLCLVTSLDAHSWCVQDDTDVYHSALDYVQSSSINRTQLQRLIDDVFDRAGCPWLQKTSPNNITCKQCLTSDNIYEVLQLARNERLNRTSFYRSSTIIVSFIYQLTNSCDVNNQRNWTQLSYEHFADEVLKLSSVFEHDHHNHSHDEHHDHSHGKHDHSHDHDDHGNKTDHDHSHGKHNESHDEDHDHSKHNDTHKGDADQSHGKHNASHDEDHDHSHDEDHDHSHGDESHDEDEEHDKSLSKGQLEQMLRLIADNYQPGPSMRLNSLPRKQLDFNCLFGNLKSFSSEDIHSDELDRISVTVVMKLLAGECIERVEENAPVSTTFINSIYEVYATQRNSCRLSVKDIERIMSQLGTVSSHDDDNEHGSHDDDDDHAGHDHKRRRRRRRETSHSHDDHSKCYSAEQLLESFDVDEASGVSRTEFHQLCPALVQQAATCRSPAKPPKPTNTTRPSDAEVYGYGTASVFIITVISLFGLLVVRFRLTAAYKHVVNVMLGLAVGTLVGDAMLHLIPHAVGLHAHDEHDHDHGHELVTIEPYVWKMLSATLTFWVFFVLQIILQWASNAYNRRKQQQEDGEAGAEGKYAHRMSNVVDESTESADDSQWRSHSISDVLMHNDGGGTSAAWMVTVGDAVHNFADGLAIGSAYTVNWQVGLSTSIAVFFHELPHEFGDIAVMLRAGWSTPRVALFQILSGATAFIGLYIGISISQQSAEAQQWIFILASAMFLYVALADVVPELFEYQAKYGPLSILILSNIGILFGIAAMFVLAIFEGTLMNLHRYF